ncbi:DUF3718 domain-containing protein [Shewanella sp. Isolate7]|uniref:DUF3718 domain-containing protein n=1 Tax=Shewanella sp. Isolate7 TaxID=2908528 RepID=UPI001EFCFA28|nr:DUF3718 domain-containing protein [Shewanella sp. Isolate7]MCG9723280.1 DUF3718 domain-containing protein [Shewanella sp. Isolate7]
MDARILLAPVLLLGLGTACATEYRFVGTDTKPETQMCIAAGSNKAGKLRLPMNEQHGSTRYHANSVQCNGKSLVQFAYQYGADKAYTFLAGHSYDRNKAIESVTIKDLSAANAQGDDEVVYVQVSSR